MNVSNSLDASNSALIRHTFDDINALDEGLSFDRIYNYLSRKAGRNFSNELLIEIFRSIDKDQGSVISYQEFIDGYSKAEFIIKSQINQLKSQISENLQALAGAQKNLIEAKSRKNQNIGENNIFVTIKHAKDLKNSLIPKNKDLIVLIRCESNEIQTNTAVDPINPEWNQSFTFPISQGIGEISFHLYSTQRSKLTNQIGEVFVPFRALSNQELHEDYLDLKSMDDYNKISGRLLVSIQWIYDLIVYLEGMVKQYEEIIRDDKNEMQNLDAYLAELRSPITNYSMPEWIKGNPKFEEVEKIVSEKVQTVIEKALGEDFKLPNITKVLLAIFLFTCIFTSFLRPDFFNLTISVLTLLHFIKQNNISFHFRMVTLCIVLSQFSDLIWLVNYTSVKPIQVWMGLSLSHKISICLSIANFISKFVYAGVFWKTSIDLR